MTDLKNVIWSLERCTCRVPDACQDCMYYEEPTPECYLHLERDALEWLKKLEPKPRESKAMLPCKCGCKRREHWYGGTLRNEAEGLKCMKCGFTVWGKDGTDVIRKWNRAVSNNEAN